MEYVEEICKNRSLKRWGYYIYKNGSMIKHELGEDKIRNVWSGGSIHEIDALFKEYSKKRPNTIYIVFKSDGPHFATFLNDENKLFDLFHMSEVNKMKDISIFCASIKYSSIEHLQSTHDFTNLKLLPSCFTKHFHQVPRIQGSLSNWDTKKDMAIWVGSTTGIYAENDYSGPRKHIYDASKTSPSTIYFQFTNSHFRPNEAGISCKRGAISQDTQLQYKMIICIDGWGFPGSLRWVLHSGCLPVIVCNFKIGILEHLEPWVHYVPAKSDGSDIVQNISWVLSHKDEAKTILENLHKRISETISPTFLRKELNDMF